MRNKRLGILAVVSLVVGVGVAAIWLWSRESRPLGMSVGRTFCQLQAYPDTMLLLGAVSPEKQLVYVWKTGDPFHRRTVGFEWGTGRLNLQWDSDPRWLRLAYVRIPYWMLIAGAAVVPLLWLRQKPRRPVDPLAVPCNNCDYDLRASKERCPECGTPIGSKRAKTKRWWLVGMAAIVATGCYLAIAGFGTWQRGIKDTFTVRFAEPSNIDLQAEDLRVTFMEGDGMSGFDTLQIAPDGHCRYMFDDWDAWNRGLPGFKMTDFQIDRKTLNDLRTLLRNIRFAELSVWSTGGPPGSTSYSVFVQSGKTKKCVGWGNYSTSEIQRLLEFRNTRILAANAAAIAAAKTMTDQDERRRLEWAAWNDLE